jgi:CheY-like chemotaxis protein
MPDLDGWAVLEELKADPQLADIPVVLSARVDDQSRGAALGAADPPENGGSSPGRKSRHHNACTGAGGLQEQVTFEGSPLRISGIFLQILPTGNHVMRGI